MQDEKNSRKDGQSEELDTRMDRGEVYLLGYSLKLKLLVNVKHKCRFFIQWCQILMSSTHIFVLFKKEEGKLENIISYILHFSNFL